MTLSGDELAGWTGHVGGFGEWVLGEGEVAELLLPAEAPFHSLGIWWEGDWPPHQEGGRSTWSLVSASGSSDPFYPFTEADDLSPLIAGSVGAAGRDRVSALIHSTDGPATAARLRFVGPLRLRHLTLCFLRDTLLERGTALSTEPGAVAAPGGPAQPPAGPLAADKPRVYSRSEWGAAPHQCSLTYCNTTHVAVHHTAGASDFNCGSWSQCAAKVRAIQAYHMNTRGWCDIGYNYLISSNGDIFEGRAGGDNVVAAHDGCNCGSMGASLLGYFHPPYNHAMTSAMFNALADLGAWKCDQQGIDPFGSSYYAGCGTTVRNIYGHRDVSATACPGDTVYVQMDSIRSAIRSRLGGGSPPRNDACSNPASIRKKEKFDTSSATTDGPAEPGCGFCCGETQIHRDVWFTWRADCTGSAAVDTCKSDFDTKIAVYGSTACPASFLIACNDDACDQGSSVTFAATFGRTYLIRVGGYDAGDAGKGKLLVKCR